MKPNQTLTLILALVGLWGCQKETAVADEFLGRAISVSAQTDVQNSRTTLSGSRTEWNTGDKIGVFSMQSSAVNTPMSARNGGRNSAFNGSLSWSHQNHDFYAYYPYTEGTFEHTAVPVALPAEQTQSAGGNSDHVGALDFMIAQPLASVKPGSAVNFQFTHFFTLLDIRVVGVGHISSISVESFNPVFFDSGTSDLSTMTIKQSGTGSKSVKLNLTTPAAMTTSSSTTPPLYLMISGADLTGKRLTIRMTIDGKEETLMADGPKFEPGKKYTLVVDPMKGTLAQRNVLEFISDPAFLSYCQSKLTEWDTNKDGELSATEAASVTLINVGGTSESGGTVKSLSGIEYFSGLTTLVCSYNPIESLDVSRNTQLKVFYCDNTQISSLDMTKNPALRELNCTGNKLTTLDLSNNIELEILNCDKNKIVALTLPKSNTLTTISCGGNQLTALDLSANTRLLELTCQANAISALNLSANTSLVHLSCGDNLLTELNIKPNILLKTLLCTGNPGLGDTFAVSAWDDFVAPAGFTTPASWTFGEATITLQYIFNQTTEPDTEPNT